MSIGLYTTLECVEEVKQNKDVSVRFFDNYVGTAIVTINRKVVVMNAEKLLL